MNVGCGGASKILSNKLEVVEVDGSLQAIGQAKLTQHFTTLFLAQFCATSTQGLDSCFLSTLCSREFCTRISATKKTPRDSPLCGVGEDDVYVNMAEAEVPRQQLAEREVCQGLTTRGIRKGNCSGVKARCMILVKHLVIENGRGRHVVDWR